MCELEMTVGRRIHNNCYQFYVYEYYASENDYAFFFACCCCCCISTQLVFYKLSLLHRNLIHDFKLFIINNGFDLFDYWKMFYRNPIIG